MTARPETRPGWVVTANATIDGSPVYLTADSAWTRRMVLAHATTNEEERDQLLVFARADQARVCDPYPIDVTIGEVDIEPVSLRERIRRDGPTIRVPGAH